MSIEKIQAKLFLIPQLAQTFKGSVSKANVKTTSTTSRPKVTPRVQSNKVSLKSNVITDSFTVSTFSIKFWYKELLSKIIKPYISMTTKKVNTAINKCYKRSSVAEDLINNPTCAA